MVEDDAYCIDVIHQIHTVQSALNKGRKITLEEYLNSLLVMTIRGENHVEQEQVIGEFVELFEAATKV